MTQFIEGDVVELVKEIRIGRNTYKKGEVYTVQRVGDYGRTYPISLGSLLSVNPSEIELVGGARENGMYY